MERNDRVKGGKRRVAAKGEARNGWVNLHDVEALVRLMDENGLVELEIDTGGAKVRLVRGRAALTPASAAIDSAPRSVESSVAGASGLASKAAREAHLDGSQAIISPMVGTFYRAPSPEMSPFVEVGSIVEKGDTLCIIEAMKMMNEIEAEFRGRVARVVADNGQTVEYGESLFLIEPL